MTISSLRAVSAEGAPEAILNPLSPEPDPVVSMGLPESCRGRVHSCMKYCCGGRAAATAVTGGENRKTVKHLGKHFKVKEGKNRGI